MRPPFATREDVEARHPREAALLCADEATRLPDWARFDAALIDVSTEIRAILAKRYSPAMIETVDADSAGALQLFAIDMAFYRVALAFSRQTEAIKARYDAAVKRLEGIASGRGALTFAASSEGADAAAQAGAADAPNAPLVDANPRIFTRKSMGAW